MHAPSRPWFVRVQGINLVYSIGSDRGLINAALSTPINGNGVHRELPNDSGKGTWTEKDQAAPPRVAFRVNRLLGPVTTPFYRNRFHDF